MTVKKLIKILRKQDPNKTVFVWDPWADESTDDVVLSKIEEGILIGNNAIGREELT